MTPSLPLGAVDAVRKCDVTTTGRVLWIADAVKKTGFANITHQIVGRLHAAGWPIGVLGLVHDGDPHPYPYPIFPAFTGGDDFGLGRLEELIDRTRPDVLVINNDPWNVVEYIKVIRAIERRHKMRRHPIVAYMPVDAPNVKSCRQLGGPAGLDLAIWYTRFGLEEATRAGYRGPNAIIPHGVDADLYRPHPRAEAIAKLGSPLTEDAFVVGSVNRNTPRKRLDLTMLAFAEWWKQAGRPRNAHLYLHTSWKYDLGPDLEQLALYWGLRGRCHATNIDMRPGDGVDESLMPYIYSLFDVFLATPHGEGWGLTVHEAMACAVPPIVPEYSALGEWPRGAVTYVPVTGWQVTGPATINTIGGVADLADTINAIDRLYTDRRLRAQLGLVARERAADPMFEWGNIAAMFDAHLRGVLADDRTVKPIPMTTGGTNNADPVSEQTGNSAGDENAAAQTDPPAPDVDGHEIGGPA